MPSRHEDIPNAYVNADTQKKMDIYEIFDSVSRLAVKRIWHFDC